MTTKNKTILVVDDEMNVAGLIKYQLEAKSFNVVLASDGQEALDKINILTPDLIILDVNMPRMSGLEFCRHITTAHGRVRFPLLVLTLREELEDTLREIGVADFLPKPFLMEDLIGKVEGCLSSKPKLEVVILAPVDSPVAIVLSEVLKEERYQVQMSDSLSGYLKGPSAWPVPYVCMECASSEEKELQKIRSVKKETVFKSAKLLVYSTNNCRGQDQIFLQAGADQFFNQPARYELFIEAIKGYEIAKEQ